jgi:putative nucleotidyltransferase with HDIG domain
MSLTVSVDQLRVGMFVHLDLSWMSHPFARSSFQVENAEQIRTIQGLGLKTVRWDPARSQLAASATGAAAFAPSEAFPLSVGAEATPGSPAAHLAEPVPAPPKPAETLAPVPSSAAAECPPSLEAEAKQRRAQLQSQRAAAELCQSQYAEAGEAWRSAFDKARSDPQTSRREAEALAKAMLEKMLVEGETCIRVLNAASGDRATAHAMNVSVIAMLVGRVMALDAELLADLGTGALLHDVGKLDVPERLRQLDDAMSITERKLYASHVDQGLRHAQRMGLGEVPRQIIAQHHEQSDGSGFPRQLKGEQIALAARIVALVNRFDNLCNPPVLSRAMTPHEALSLMFSQQRARWDAGVLQAFIRMMGVYPPGSVVQLNDERFALVMRVNATRPLKPEVLVYDPRVPRDEALHLMLDREPGLSIRRSFRAAQLPEAARTYLAPKSRLAYYFEPGAAIAPAEDGGGR